MRAARMTMLTAWVGCPRLSPSRAAAECLLASSSHTPERDELARALGAQGVAALHYPVRAPWWMHPGATCRGTILVARTRRARDALACRVSGLSAGQQRGRVAAAIGGVLGAAATPAERRLYSTCLGIFGV